MASTEKPKEKSGDKAKTHKLSLKGSSKLVAEFVSRIRGLALSILPSLACFQADKTATLTVPILNTHNSVRPRPLFYPFFRKNKPRY